MVNWDVRRQVLWVWQQCQAPVRWLFETKRSTKYRAGKGIRTRRQLPAALALVMVCSIVVGLMASTAQAAVQLRASANASGGDFVSYRGSSSNNTGAAATSLAITMPTGVVQNDLMIAALTIRGGTGTTISTVPSGWALLTTNGRVDSTTTLAQAVYWKLAGASEAGPYTWNFTSNKASGVILAYSNVNTSTPIDVSAGQANASSATVTSPAVTTTVANTTIVGLFGTAIGSNSPPVFTATSMANLRVRDESTGNATSSRTATMGADDFRATAGNAGGLTYTGTAAAAVNIGHTIGIRPATPGGITISKPTGTVQNDGMVATINVTGNTTLTAPAGWTSLERSVTASNQIAVETYYKVAGGSEASTYSWTWSGSQMAVGTISTYTGVDPSVTTPVNAGQANASSLSITATAVTPTAYGSLLVGVFGIFNSSAITPAVSMSPVDYMTISGGTSAVALRTATEQTFTTSSTGTRLAAAGTAGVNVGHLVALTPAVPALSQGSYRWFEHPQQIAGIDWTSRASASDSSWVDVTYGNGRFVAVATNAVMTSSDGITWTTRNPSANIGWNSVIYGNGLFVAVSTSGTTNRVMTSSDGITWTTRTTPNSSFSGIAYGNGTYVAVGSGGAAMTSPNGTAWTAQTAVSANWDDIVYDEGLFVAVSSSGTSPGVMTSPDGVTWTSQTVPATNGWTEVAYGNGQFVAVGTSGHPNQAMTSPDGISWTLQTTPVNLFWNGLAYGDGQYVATATNGTGNRVMTSPDGITWTSRTSAADNNWGGVGYGNGRFVAVGSTGTGNRVMTSENAGDSKTSLANTLLAPAADTWTSRTSTENNVWEDITYGNGLFLAVSSTGTNRVMTSPDGITWTARAGTGQPFLSVTYGEGLFVATMDSGAGANKIATSPDGIVWTTRSSANSLQYSDVTYGNGMFVAVSNATVNNPVYTSTDGTTWSNSLTGHNLAWQSVTYGEGLFVAVTNDVVGNIVMTSPDGTTWTNRTSAGNRAWQSVTYGNGTFVAVASATAAGQRVMTSPDGIAWSYQSDSAATSTTVDWNSVTYGGGLFVAVSSNSLASGLSIMTSPDGATWTNRLGVVDNDWEAVTYGNGLFVAVSSTGTGDRVMTAPVVNARVGLPLEAEDTALTSKASDSVRLRMNVPVANNPYKANDIVQQKLALQYGVRSGASCTGSETYIDVGVGTWTTRTSATMSFTSVAYGNSMYVAVMSTTSTSTQVATSPDGITWTTRTSAATNTWNSVTFGEGLFVAVASTGTGNRVMTSPDGITWTSQSTTGADLIWLGVTYGGGQFAAVASNGSGNSIMTSPDGITWTARSSTPVAGYSSITYGNGLFVAIDHSAGASTSVVTSTDGVTWTMRSVQPGGNNYTSLTYGNGLFVAVSDAQSGNVVMTSPDGFDWTARQGASTRAWNAVTYGDGLFVAVAESGTGDRVMTSPDGTNWTTRTPAADISWNAVTYGDGLFVAMANSGGGSDRTMTMSAPVHWGGSRTVGDYAGYAVLNSNDPTEGSGTARKHYYVTNNFFSAAYETAAGDYVMYDFDLDISNTAYEASYCFRVVYQDGTALSSYSAYPDITRCTSPSLDRRMRHGTAFCGTTKRMFWQSARTQ